MPPDRRLLGEPGQEPRGGAVDDVGFIGSCHASGPRASAPARPVSEAHSEVAATRRLLRPRDSPTCRPARDRSWKLGGRVRSSTRRLDTASTRGYPDAMMAVGERHRAIVIEATPGTDTQPRLASVDVLRGLVMVVMALDHVRDFFGSTQVGATDLQHTTVALFFTRWITHFCAPVFVLLAGTSAFLWAARGRTTTALSWFLLTRGVWLIFLELTVVRFGWFFNLDYSMFVLQVIWAIGASMVILAALATRRCKSPAAHREFPAGGALGRDRLAPSPRSSISPPGSRSQSSCLRSRPSRPFAASLAHPGTGCAPSRSSV